MTLEQAYIIVLKFQKWRLGIIKEYIFEPSELTEAIDMILIETEKTLKYEN